MSLDEYNLAMHLMDLMEDCVNNIKSLNLKLQNSIDEFDGFQTN